jgi:low affinity Fe/Cu permease
VKPLETFSTKATRWTGTSWAFLLAILTIVVWAVWGPLTTPPFNDTWQLVINTLTTLVTFLMVFLIQRSQNKDSLAIHTKLNELLAASKASNRLIDIEELGEEEIRELHRRYQEIAIRAMVATDPCARTSVDKRALEETQSRNGTTG